MQKEDPDVIDRLLAAARARAAVAPTSSRRHPPGRRRVVAGVAAALAVALVIAAVSTRHSDGGAARPLASAPQTNGPDTTTRRAAPARQPSTQSTSRETALIDLVPAPWRPRCRTAPALDSHALEAVVCAPGAAPTDGGPATVDLRRYADAAAFGRAFAVLAGDSPRGGDTSTARCARGEAENRAWRSPSSPTESGRYVCRRDAAGVHLAWTEPRGLLIVQATRPDDRLDALFAWWLRTAL